MATAVSEPSRSSATESTSNHEGGAGGGEMITGSSHPGGRWPVRSRRPRDHRKAGAVEALGRDPLHLQAQEVRFAASSRACLIASSSRHRRGRAIRAAAPEVDAGDSILLARATRRCRRATPCTAAPSRVPAAPGRPRGTGCRSWIRSRVAKQRIIGESDRRSARPDSPVSCSAGERSARVLLRIHLHD